MGLSARSALVAVISLAGSRKDFLLLSETALYLARACVIFLPVEVFTTLTGCFLLVNFTTTLGSY